MRSFGEMFFHSDSFGESKETVLKLCKTFGVETFGTKPSHQIKVCPHK